MTTPAAGVEWQVLESANAFRREEHAALIEAARARIPQVRQREVRLRLTDRAGTPLAHRTVRLHQVTSDFLWGFSGAGLVEAMREPHAMAVHERRRPFLHLARLFNTVNLVNYWEERVWPSTPPGEDLLGYPDYECFDRAVQWACGHGLTAKGHPLWWGVPKAVPTWMAGYDQRRRAMFREVRLRQIAARFKGRVSVYDAVNEALWEPPLSQTAQRVWPHNTPIPDLVADIGEVLAIVREEDPAACLVVNDYGVQVGDTEIIPIDGSDGRRISRDQQARRYLDLMLALKAAGAAPDAVGVQAFHRWGRPDQQQATYDLLAQAGLPIHITEFQPGGSMASDLAKAGAPRDEIVGRIADYTDACITLAFGHPAVEAFFFWYDQHYLFDGRNPGLPGAWYRKLEERIRREWMSDLTATTDAEGRLSLRVFTGTHQVRLAEAGAAPAGAEFRVPAACRGEVRLDLAIGA